MKLNLKYAEGVWIKYKGNAEAKIKMLSNSKSMLLSGKKLNMEDLLVIYDECLVGWRGFDDEKDKEIKYNDKNRQLMFEANMDFITFVVEEQGILRDKFEASLKNSSSSRRSNSVSTPKTQKK